MASETYTIDLETALRDLLECFEPTSPPTIETVSGRFEVTEETEQAIANAERVLSEEEMPYEI